MQPLAIPLAGNCEAEFSLQDVFTEQLTFS